MTTEDYKLNITECCKYSDDENQAVAQIKKWILSLSRDMTCSPENIAISQHRQELEDGSSQKHTLICICDTSAPVIKIEKPVVEITLEDVLCVYIKINECEEVGVV
tara:strand:- start:2766 stop:3083 length:318 start_codon:yes stop_codon:yes gene_type:complete